MGAIRRVLLRLVTLCRGGRAERELAREIEAHLALLEEELLARGMSAEEARRAARRAFGGVEQVKERHRDARSFRWLAGWPMDLRLGVRMLRKSPGLTAVALLALSVAIGGGVAYLELVTDQFVPALPLPHGDRVVGIVNWDASADRPDRRALHDYLAWRGSLRTIEQLGVSTPIARNLITDEGRAEPVAGVAISPSAFAIAPTPPLLGRPLLPDDERPGAPPVVVVGYQVWRSRLGSDPAAVGRIVRLGTTSYTVVGVMPEHFGFPVNSSLWIPFSIEGPSIAAGQGPEVFVFGRLAEGVSLENAQAELTAVARRLEGDAPGSRAHIRPLVKRYVDALAAGDRQEMWILYSVNALFVGLLALCGTNVATLVFARTVTREGEITVRTALGASRGRIVAQLFAEALVLSGAAALVGVACASIGIRVLHEYLAAQGLQQPFWWNETMSFTSLVYAAILALLAAAMIGIVPALKATGPEMQDRMKHAAAGGAGVKFGRLWTGIIVSQVAVTVIFLLSVVSLAWNATGGHRARLAFDFPVSDYVSGRLDLDRGLAGEGDPAAAAAHRVRFLARYRAIEQRFESDGHIAAVTYGATVPGLGGGEFWVELDGMEPVSRPADGPLWVRTTGVAADFFETFGAPIVRGRTFSSDEIAGERDVAVVDETFVRLVLGGGDPIGVRIRHQQGEDRPAPGPWLTIVGVVRDLAQTSGKSTEDAVLYRPAAPGGATPIRLIVRVKGDAGGASDRIRTLAAAAGADVRIEDLRPLAAVYEAENAPVRVIARVLACVAAVALLLATAGVYALMSFTVARRTREIGIRAALGASPRGIVRAIFSRAFMQVALGVAGGSVPGAALVAFGAPEVARGGGGAVALAAVVAVAGLIAVIALFACAVPARRALRIQPTDALRLS